MENRFVGLQNQVFTGNEKDAWSDRTTPRDQNQNVSRSPQILESREMRSNPPSDDVYGYLFDDNASSPAPLHTARYSPIIEGSSITEDRIESKDGVWQCGFMSGQQSLTGGIIPASDHALAMDSTVARVGADTGPSFLSNPGISASESEPQARPVADGGTRTVNLQPQSVNLAPLHDTDSESAAGYQAGLEQNTQYAEVGQFSVPVLQPIIHTELTTFTRRLSRDLTPTESQLDEMDFEFKEAIECIKSQHTQQALHNIDPSLSRRELFRIYRWAVQEDKEKRDDSLPDMSVLDTDIDELEDASDTEFEDDVSPCEEPCSGKSRRKSSVRQARRLKPRASERHWQPESSSACPDEVAHSVLLHSKPYLSEVTSIEAQSQHPSVIPRSPQRTVSRASSLASETKLGSSEELHDPWPLTEGALAEQNRNTPPPRAVASAFDPSINERQSSPFRIPAEPASSLVCRNSPFKKIFDSTDASSIKAGAGSPAPMLSPVKMPSRPDTPRPSLSGEIIGYPIEIHFKSITWPSRLTPAQLVRSASPSPASDGDVSMLNTSAVESPTPARVVGQQNIESTKSLLQVSPTNLRLRAADVAKHIDAAAILPSSSALRLQEATTDFRQAVQNGHGSSLSIERSGTVAHHGRTDVSVERALDDLWREPAGRSEGQEYCPERRHRSESTATQPIVRRDLVQEVQLSTKNPSDPFVEGSDTLALPELSPSSPLTPLEDIASQLYQAKRDPKSSTNPGFGGKKSTTRGRAASSKSPQKAVVHGTAKIPARRRKSITLGIRGGVKVAKTRSTSRRTSNRHRRISNSADIPDVPPLPIDMDVDQSVTSKNGLQTQSALPLPLQEETAVRKPPALPGVHIVATPHIDSKTPDRGPATDEVLRFIEEDQQPISQPGTGSPTPNLSRKKNGTPRKKPTLSEGKLTTCGQSTYATKMDDTPQHVQSEGDIDLMEQDVVPQVKPTRLKLTMKSSPIKQKPAARRSRPKPDANTQESTLKTPPRARKVRSRLTPESADRGSGRERSTSTRRSPRLIEKEKLGEGAV